VIAMARARGCGGRYDPAVRGGACNSYSPAAGDTRRRTAGRRGVSVTEARETGRPFLSCIGAGLSRDGTELGVCAGRPAACSTSATTSASSSNDGASWR
jgi:hypothetical protein